MNKLSSEYNHVCPIHLIMVEESPQHCYDQLTKGGCHVAGDVALILLSSQLIKLHQLIGK